MSRFKPVEKDGADGRAAELLDRIQRELGMTPNIMKIMANAPKVLEGYLSFSAALAEGALPARLREQLALTVAEANGCQYCLAAHTAIGRIVGLSEQEIGDSRQADAVDSKSEVALRFARKVVDERANVSNADVDRLRHAGFNDEQIVEIIANVAINTFTNYFNHIALTEVDFPAVEALPQTAG